MNNPQNSTRPREIPIPIVQIDGESWLLLKKLDRVFHFRAESIDPPKRVKEPSDHRCDESRAEGSVKCRPKGGFWNLSQYENKKGP